MKMKNLAFRFFSKIDLSPLDAATELARDIMTDIMTDIMQFRRTPGSYAICDTSCPDCQSPHLAKVISAIRREEPITLILPAFPGKSPNRAKVLGPMPDMAERRALQFLENLCDRVQRRYSPGARIILCSDGRVFSDVIGMREEDVTGYQRELDLMIEELGLVNISTFNLDGLCAGRSFDQMRHELMERYGQSLEALQEKVRRGGKDSDRPEDQEANRMYCGITRFLVEDSTYPGQTKSRTAIQKDCRIRAYEVIRRSNAWSELLAERFPEAVRLSIHPQTCGAKKLGIRLMGNESWMTPWHGVAMETKEGFVLVKRSEAEALGARLVRTKDGRPSHFDLTVKRTMNLERGEVGLSL